MSDDLGTEAENTWCPGCGNFGILNAVKSAVEKLEDEGLERERIIISAGIGCHAKIFDYLDLSGFYSIHGRAVSTIQGIKFANPELEVIGFGGDGDSYGEGLAHLIFAAKRNADITMVIHNNGNYALTTGQTSPTSVEGFKGPSTPEGSKEKPINPLDVLLSSGASFISRGYPGKMNHLSDLLVKAVMHEGFSLVDVLQPCVTFNDTYEKYNELVEILDQPAETRDEARELALKEESLPIGVLYEEDIPVFNEKVYPEKNPLKDKLSKKKRLKCIEEIIENRKG